jgi:hypothetical protein
MAIAISTPGNIPAGGERQQLQNCWYDLLPLNGSGKAMASTVQSGVGSEDTIFSKS